MEILWEGELFCEEAVMEEGFLVDAIRLNTFKVIRRENGDTDVLGNLYGTQGGLVPRLKFMEILKIHKRKSTTDIPQSLKDHFEALDIFDKMGE